MDQPLAKKTVAILVANGFAETQMTTPQKALIEAGAKTAVISPEPGLVNGWHETAWGHYFPIDVALDEALGADYDVLLIPGGRRSVGKLSGNEHTTRIIRSFADAGKPIAAIGDGVVLLSAAERLDGRKVTTAEDVRDEVKGAEIVDEPIVLDGNLLTGRDAEALEDFTAQMLEHFGEAKSLQDAA